MALMQGAMNNTTTDRDLFYPGSRLIETPIQLGQGNMQRLTRPSICKQLLTSNQREATGFDKENKKLMMHWKKVFLQKPQKPGIVSVRVVEASKLLIKAYFQFWSNLEVAAAFV